MDKEENIVKDAAPDNGAVNENGDNINGVENGQPAAADTKNDAANENVESGDTNDSDADAEKDTDKNVKTRDLKKQIKELKSQLTASQKEAEKLKAEAAESADKYMRLAAEYDNFRRRSVKEREGVYGDAYYDALMKMLPTIDNLERASQYTDADKLADGFKLIMKNLPDMLSSMGIESFGDAGDDFDPSMHSAVMMAEDSGVEEGKIVSVLQRGYRRGDKILRYAAVTVSGS